MGPGMFQGLWSGISNTLGHGAAEISELTGSADKKRAQELALKQLDIQQAAKASSDKIKLYIIIGVVLFLIVGALASKRS